MTDAGPAALAGLKVLDLTRVLAGPLCAMTLGDMGAEVIKVEPPAGDDTRAWGPPEAGGEAAYFLGVNRNKRSVRLDLSKPSAREVLGQLIGRADVLVENYKLGTLQRWGFGPDWMAAHAPRLIHCSITGYGETGPKAALPGYDFVLQAESGLMSITGEVDGEPVKYGVAIVDIATGLYATIAILGALNSRTETGRGQKVSVSLFETGLSLLANVASNHLVTGKDAGRFGNGHPNIVPYSTYPTADGSIVLAVGNDGQFARLSEVAGHPEWARDPRFAKNVDRVRNRAVFEPALAAALQSHDTAWWIDRLRAAGVPCGAVNGVAAALADPQTAARDMIMTMQHPTAGTLRMLGFPITMAATPLTAALPPPLLGQHTLEVLRGELGLDDAAVARLIAEGAIAAQAAEEPA
jgi:crotonobetainyl-CoA:carnitine CoA-transferase CaiB-like acyl-CoA transferase